MLWSDPPDEPPEELRDAQAKLARLAWLLPGITLVTFLLAATSR
ncbi:morphogenic membrane protein MmpB [Streptomyces sp. AJS327]|nr:hypothetical protein [Streptomyces sp. AJS327]